MCQSLCYLLKQKQRQLPLGYYRVIKPFWKVLRTKQFSLHGAVVYNVDKSVVSSSAPCYIFCCTNALGSCSCAKGIAMQWSNSKDPSFVLDVLGCKQYRGFGCLFNVPFLFSQIKLVMSPYFQELLWALPGKMTEGNILKIQGAAGRNKVPERGSNLNFIERKFLHIIWFKSLWLLLASDRRFLSEIN